MIGTATLSFSGGALTCNAPVTCTALTIGSLSGMLVATAGAVAGSATSNNLPEDPSVNVATPTGNAYFTRARVLATPLTGISSTHVILATDSVLTAFGKIDNVLGGNYPAGTVTGNLTVTGTLTTSGAVTLNTGLNGILQVTAGLISASATTSALTEGSNLYFTTARVLATALSGYVSGAGSITTSDTILTAIQKLNGNIAAVATTAVLTGYASTTGTISSADTVLTAIEKLNGNIGAVTNPLTVVLTGYVSTTGTITTFDTILTAIEKLNGNIAGVAATAVLTGYASTTGAIASSDTILTAIEKLNGNLAASAANVALTGYVSTTGVISATDTILVAIEKLNGNLAASATTATLSGYVSTTGTITSADTILTAIQKLNGNLAVVTNPLSATLTGYSSVSGTISSSDTILTAIQKLNGNDGLRLALAGGTITGTLGFSGTSNPGLIVNQLSGSQIGALPTSGTNYGNIVYNTSTNQLNALINGSYVAIGGVYLPLSAGSSFPLTATLYIQDGLTTAIQVGSSWSIRTSSSNNNFDFQNGSTTVLTCDNGLNVSIPNGVLKVQGHQVVGPQQPAVNNFSPAGGWSDGTAYTDFGNLIGSYNTLLTYLRTHGLIST